MIRQATAQDIPHIAAIYDSIHALEEQGLTTTGWKKGIYPTKETAQAALQKGSLFVYEKDGQILASAKIDHVQEEEYALAPWQQDAPPGQVMVLHTLVVSPHATGQGIAREFVAFYEDYALKNNCPYLRMDTNARNTRARRLYQRLGYREAGIVPADFQSTGKIDLVCLEKTLTTEE